MTNQPNTPVEVTQADYRLAAEIMGYKDANQARASSTTIKLGHRKLSGPLARHRITAIAQARREALEEARQLYIDGACPDRTWDYFGAFEDALSALLEREEK